MTVSIAGLPRTKAWVLVGPPLLARVVLRMLAKAAGSLPLEVAVMSAKVLQRHWAGTALGVDSNALFRRETDRFIRDKLGKQSFDVGADRIAWTAHSALTLLSALRERLHAPIPLAWSPRICGLCAIEVYPAATLKAHAICSRG